ncbi:hypothetical protein [Streptomyces malaysiensis]|uniref:hypothetical protein n=1 Tax=Streptomyces malaysiensis TaxID=92644 RepID=UPI001313FF18|nr:hypothetical protein [Streptomyces autolyticus]
MTLEKRPSIQVISAHSGDFVWRRVQAVRNGGAKTIVQAEAYQRVFPIVGSELR